MNGHTHDERYYTESEVNNLLNGKMNNNPSCIELVGNSAHYIDFHYGGSNADNTSRIIEETAGTITVYNNLKVGSALTVGGTNIISALNGKAASGHTHDDRYYTKAQADNRVFLRTRSNKNNISFEWTGSKIEVWIDSTKVRTGW